MASYQFAELQKHNQHMTHHVLSYIIYIHMNHILLDHTFRLTLVFTLFVRSIISYNIYVHLHL